MPTAEPAPADPPRTWPAAGEVHLWSAALGAVRADPALLDADARRRALRLREPLAAARFVACRCLLQGVLAGYLDPNHGVGAFSGGEPVSTSPEKAPGPAAAVRREASGRSVLPGVEGLHFSLARAGDRGVIAVAAAPVGVDLEPYEAPADMERLALEVMTPAERTALAQANPAARAGRLHALWTNKEAVLKALGLGFRIDPRGVEVGWGEGVRRLAPPGQGEIALDLRRFDLGDAGGAVVLAAPILAVIQRRW